MIDAALINRGLLKFPKILVVLSVILILEPFINIYFISLDTGFAFSKVFSKVCALSGYFDIFLFWLLFPISGVCLLITRPFTYWSFIALQAFCVIYHIFFYQSYSWPYLSEEVPLFTKCLIASSIFLTFFILGRKTRTIFLNKRFRWWEIPTRLGVKLPAILKYNTKDTETEIIDLSINGILLNLSNRSLEAGDLFQISFNVDGTNFVRICRIKRMISPSEENLAGCEFINQTFFQKLALRKLILKLEKEKRYLYKR